VDPVSHLLFGRTVALTIPRRPVKAGVTAALVLGSILPDVDAVLAPGNFEAYLSAHASGTHSLLGSLIEALVLALGLRVVVAGSRVWPLLLASWTGVAGHVFWDLADGSDIGVLRPFSDAVFGWHLVAMAEPLVLTVLAVAVLWAWRSPLRSRQIAIAAIVVLGVALGLKRASQDRARAWYAAAVVADAPATVAIAPDRDRLLAWWIFDRIGDRVRAWNIDAWSGAVSLAFEYQDAADTPVVARSLQLPVVRALVGLSRIPFVRTEADGARRLVLWSDMSTCTIRGCDVSFGGAFDSNAVPLYQLIRIGGFVQRHPLPPR
jgi:membrane-bound metal-dependent hydrolase YbcI (DUF457 family)